MAGHVKDEILDRLARRANVAQFVSFGPDLAQRHAWIRGCPPGHRFGSVAEAVTALLAASPEASLNVRSWQPDNPKSRSFLYGRTDPGEILTELRRLSGEGLYTILRVTSHFGGLLRRARIPSRIEEPAATSPSVS